MVGPLYGSRVRWHVFVDPDELPLVVPLSVVSEPLPSVRKLVFVVRCGVGHVLWVVCWLVGVCAAAVGVGSLVVALMVCVGRVCCACVVVGRARCAVVAVPECVGEVGWVGALSPVVVGELRGVVVVWLWLQLVVSIVAQRACYSRG